jgi:hypothetical protein
LNNYDLDDLDGINNFNNFDIEQIKNSVMKEHEDLKRQNDRKKQKLIRDKEAQIKNDLEKIVRENIIKQLKIDEENEKLKKYYELTREKLKKTLSVDDEDELIEFAKNKLNGDKRH